MRATQRRPASGASGGSWAGGRIPGPRGHWLLGSAREFAGDPVGFFVGLQATYGPVARYRLGPVECTLVSAPELVQGLLVDRAEAVVKSARGRRILRRFLGEGLLISEGEVHRRQRAELLPAFRPGRVGEYAAATLGVVEQTIRGWRPGTELDLAEAMMGLSMAIVARTLFGRDGVRETAAVGQALAELQALSMRELTSPVVWPEWLPTATRRRRRQLLAVVDRELAGFIRDAIGSGLGRGDTEEGPPSLLGALVAGTVAKGRSPDDRELRDQLLTLFVAGHETTASALTWAWYALSRDPEVEARFHRELNTVLGEAPLRPEDLARLPYTTMVLKESLRLYPPAWCLVGRDTVAAVEVGDLRLPRGSAVFIAPYVLHRLPEHFPEPDRFIPERFAEDAERRLPRHLYIPFGTGHRQCIGRGISMTSAALILAAIGRRFRFRRVDAGAAAYSPQITLMPQGGLPVVIEGRSRSKSETL